jgi:hypothetical protein
MALPDQANSLSADDGHIRQADCHLTLSTNSMPSLQAVITARAQVVASAIANLRG